MAWSSSVLRRDQRLSPTSARPRLATAASTSPSPSRSPSAAWVLQRMSAGSWPAGFSFWAKRPSPWFHQMRFSPQLVTKASRSPSPSRSARAAEVLTSTTSMRGPGVNQPFPWFHQTWSRPQLATYASRSPSPSRSPKATSRLRSRPSSWPVMTKRPRPSLSHTRLGLRSVLATKTSRSPSPSRSPRATPQPRSWGRATPLSARIGSSACAVGVQTSSANRTRLPAAHHQRIEELEATQSFHRYLLAKNPLRRQSAGNVTDCSRSHAGILAGERRGDVARRRDAPATPETTLRDEPATPAP